MTDPLDIEAIRARRAAASDACGYRESGHAGRPVYRLSVQWTDRGGMSHPDAEFLSHAYRDVPALLAEIDRLRAAARAFVGRADGPTATAADAVGYEAARFELCQALGIDVVAGITFETDAARGGAADA